MDIREAVKAWRKVNGLNKRQLALKAGLRKAAVRQIEHQCNVPFRGKREEKLRTIAKTLNITFEELCAGPPVGTKFKYIDNGSKRRNQLALPGLRRLRGEHQLRLYDLEKPTGYSHTYLGKIERGDTRACSAVLETLSTYFKCSIAELYNDG
jgi:transcriptional regulator with XRE-family HTH domain